MLRRVTISHGEYPKRLLYISVLSSGEFQSTNISISHSFGQFQILFYLF